TPLLPAISLAAASSAALSRATMATSTPSRASSLAIALPMPRLPPVTIAVLPLSSRSMGRLLAVLVVGGKKAQCRKRSGPVSIAASVAAAPGRPRQRRLDVVGSEPAPAGGDVAVRAEKVVGGLARRAVASARELVGDDGSLHGEPARGECGLAARHVVGHLAAG